MLITCQINFDVSFIQFFGTFKSKRQKEIFGTSGTCEKYLILQCTDLNN